MELKSQTEIKSSELLQIVSFRIANEEYGINIQNVQEINRMVQITQVPNSPDFVEGVVNLRGNIIPIIELRKKLGLPRKEHDKNTRIIVAGVKDTTAGFIADAVSEVLRIPQELLEAPPEITAGVNSRYIKSVVKLENKLLILIDLEKILTGKEEYELAETI